LHTAVAVAINFQKDKDRMSYIPTIVLGTVAAITGGESIVKISGAKKHHKNAGQSVGDMILGGGLALATLPMIYGAYALSPSQLPKTMESLEKSIRNEAKKRGELGDKHLKNGNPSLAKEEYDKQNQLIDAADRVKVERLHLQENSKSDKHVSADQSPIDEELAQHRPEPPSPTNTSKESSGSSTPDVDTPDTTPPSPKDGMGTSGDLNLADANLKLAPLQQAANYRQAALRHEQNGKPALADKYNASAQKLEEVNPERRFTMPLRA